MLTPILARLLATSLLLAVGLAACAPASLGPPATPDRHAPAPRDEAPPSFSLLAAPKELPPAPPPAALLPLTRAFARVPLPKRTLPLISLAGRRDEVWMLTERGAVLRWQGGQLHDEGRAACRPPGVWSRTTSRWIAASDAELFVGVAHDETRGRGSWPKPSWEEARRVSPGRWACVPAQPGKDTQLVVRAFGASLLRFAPADRPALTLDHRILPFPSLDAAQHDLAASAPHDVWLHRADGDVLHGNGVGWEERPTGLAVLLDLWVDPTGVAWVLGAMEESDEERREGEVLLRWEHAARGWARVPTPPGFRAGLARGVGSEVWFLGRRAFYQWDGRVLRSGPAPLADVRDAWGSPGGELWVAGADAARDVDPADAGPTGVLLRAAVRP